MSVIKHWRETWETNKTLFWVEAFSTLMGMAACSLLNFFVEQPNMVVILTLYIVSAVGLAWGSYIRKASFIVLLMMFYAVVSTMGLTKLIL